MRPRWRNVLEAFAAMGGEATKAAQDKAQRLLLENGVTFVAQGDRDSSRPWRLDLFPLLIDPEEWTAIERGVTQRARLLNELLVDLYGEQRVLKEKVLPPGLVFGNSAVLAAVHERLRARQSAPALRRVRSRALRPTAAGGCSAIARRRRRARATRSRIASCRRSACRSCSRIATSGGSRASSARSASGS